MARPFTVASNVAQTGIGSMRLSRLWNMVLCHPLTYGRPWVSVRAVDPACQRPGNHPRIPYAEASDDDAVLRQKVVDAVAGC